MKKSLLVFFTIIFTWVGLPQENNQPNFTPNNQHGGIVALSDEIIHVVLDGGYFVKTIDGGLSWEQYNTGVDVEFYDLVFYDTNIGFAIGQAGTIFKTVNAGESWSQVIVSTTADLYSINIVSLNNIWIVGNYGTILHSTDSGNTWIPVTEISSERLNYINFKDENIGYIAGDQGTLLYSNNGGATWDSLDVGTTDELYIISITENSVEVLAGPDRDFYYRAGNNLYISSNNLDWTSSSVEGQTIAPISGFHFQNDLEGYLVDSADLLCECCDIEILKTTDGGETWGQIYFEEWGEASCNAYAGFSDISFLNEQRGYVLIGDIILTIIDDEIFPHLILLETDEFKKPQNFTIYPNPAGEILNLKLQNPNTENLTFEIVDITGKTVITIENVGDTATVNTSQLQSGLYFAYVREGEKAIDYKKLLIN